ncbi:BRCA1-associated ATM activator 1 [Spea bombifrons]|uniref:BRCA1-associated ATM activator 1 n=1 Tax=Spea bombifrons TaxID=233779 RepID=UPI0023493E15|nr:BRCA1-associated ATM activator 1 [Spea bombifrons]
MDTECSQLLPHVCGVLIDNRQLMSDDSVFEKLLDWFTSLVSSVPAKQLLEDNQCIIGLLQQVLNVADTDPSLLSFSMKLTGMFAASEEGFDYLLNGDVIQDMFGEFSWTNVTWRDAVVRMGWINGLTRMVQHHKAVCFLPGSGALQAMLDLQMDPSLFVASAVNDLIAHVFLTSVKVQPDPKPTNISDLPAVSGVILTHLERSLCSGVPTAIGQSIKTLAAIFKGCTNEMAQLLWLQVSAPIRDLLDQKPARGALCLEELLLAASRFPAFRDSDCDVWVTMRHALKNLNTFQSVSLAAEIMKLDYCPEDVSLQATSVLLHPLDYILKVSSVRSGQPGLLDELVCDPAAVEYILSEKMPCISLLCHCLCYLKELCDQNCLKIQIPHESVLSSVVTLLQFCIGQASPTSSLGSTISKFLIGCLRVQRSALDAVGALSRWPMSRESLTSTYNVLLAYLENPDSDPTVLKKTLQALLKWLQASSTPENCNDWAYSLTFLKALWPVVSKRFCSPTWEHRDTTLEFVTELVDSLKEQEGFRQALNSSGVPRLVLDLLKDPESYVRASAVICLGQLVEIADLYQTFAEEGPMSKEPMSRESIVPNLLDILSEDTEGFPRRAVVKVFIEWQKLRHMQNLHEPEKLLRRILDVTRNDLDWEVKVNALDMANIFADETFTTCGANSCPYAVGLPTGLCQLSEVVKRFNRVGLFSFLFDALCDCDRIVALKACEILICLKSKLSEESLPTSRNSELHGIEWLECTLSNLRLKDHQAGGQNSVGRTDWVADILMKVDLETLKSSLSMGSDSKHQTPWSLLQDIRTTLWGGEEHDADCY